MEVTGFGGVTEYTMGHVQLVLRVGPIIALTRFHVVNAETLIMCSSVDLDCINTSWCHLLTINVSREGSMGNQSA